MAGSNFGFAGIATEKLTEENYDNWKECLKSYFIAQGLWGVVTGDEEKPAETSPEYEAWNRKNAMALHAIQISCGKDTMSKLRGNESAKYEWDLLAQKVRMPLPNGKSVIKEVRSNICEHQRVYEAVKKDNWEIIRCFLEKPNAVRESITSNGDTVLHVAVMEDKPKIVKKLMKSESGADLELKNDMGYTAFFIAAINGFKEMVEAMLEKNGDLVIIKDSHGLIPIVAASFYSATEVLVRYLYTKTPHEVLNSESPDRGGATLLNCLISDEIYDLALDLLKKYPLLGFVEDLHRNYAIRLLAHKRSAFPSGNKYIFWKKWIYDYINVKFQTDDEDSQSSDEENVIRSNTKQKIGVQVLNALRRIFWKFLTFVVSDINDIYEKKLKHAQAEKILNCMFEHIPNLTEDQLAKIKWDEALHDAIKKGINEVIVAAMKYTPEIIWRKDKKGRTIFAYAIVQRQENIFSHVYNLGAKKRIAVIRHDIFGNNFLHLAAKLSPQSRLDRISGAALQMQRELEWFEEVRKILPPKYMEEVNENNKTPSELFTEEHDKLRKEGESWMKNTAASCMVVATLIAAVMFTSAFTVPGGNKEDSGQPNFLNHNVFLIFALSNALSLFSSCTSVLVFLGILTSRYTEKDFRKCLPMKLVVGLFTLFFSIVTMMACFSAAIFLILKDRLHWASIPIIVLSIIPIALYGFFQFPLLIEILICTYGRGIFNESKSAQKERSY